MSGFLEHDLRTTRPKVDPRIQPILSQLDEDWFKSDRESLRARIYAIMDSTNPPVEMEPGEACDLILSYRLRFRIHDAIIRAKRMRDSSRPNPRDIDRHCTI